jgi:hypothetical protein
MLPSTTYWLGLTRDDSTLPFQFLDGTQLAQTPSNEPYATYAHWSWNMNSLAYDATKSTWSCIQVGACHRASAAVGCELHLAAQSSSMLGHSYRPLRWLP